MVDLQETPAVPPTDYGGDDRLGMTVAGLLLIGIGWGGALLLNLLLHAVAPAGGTVVFLWRIYPHPGAFAVATAILGFLTGALGAGIALVARDSPSGPVVLPGFDYSKPQ